MLEVSIRFSLWRSLFVRAAISVCPLTQMFDAAEPMFLMASIRDFKQLFCADGFLIVANLQLRSTALDVASYGREDGHYLFLRRAFENSSRKRCKISIALSIFLMESGALEKYHSIFLLQSDKSTSPVTPLRPLRTVYPTVDPQSNGSRYDISLA